MESRTHLAINPELCGVVDDIELGSAVVELRTRPEMAVDDRGLVHGGFVFGLADYAAMVAVNDPNVVLGGAEMRFLKPVVVDEVLRAHAHVDSAEGKKHKVTVTVRRGQEPVFEGTLTCFVLPQHVLG